MANAGHDLLERARSVGCSTAHKMASTSTRLGMSPRLMMSASPKSNSSGSVCEMEFCAQ